MARVCQQMSFILFSLKHRHGVRIFILVVRMMAARKYVSRPVAGAIDEDDARMMDFISFVSICAASPPDLLLGTKVQFQTNKHKQSICICIQPCVRASERASERVSVRACVRACE